MKLFYIFAIVVAFSTLGCKSKKSEDPIPAALDPGTIIGNLYYLDSDGKKVTVPFEYKHITSDSVSKYFSNGVGGYYKINLFRQQLGNDESFIKFRRLYGDNDANGLPMAPKETEFIFSINRLINNKSFKFYGFFYSSPGSRSHCTITNFSFDTVTNKLMFNFEAYFHPDDIDFGLRYDTTTPATIKGSVNVIVVKRPYFN